MTQAPSWLAEAKELCRNAGIEIAGWGVNALVVVATSPESADAAATALGNLGFHPVKDEQDENAGLLTLSRTCEGMPSVE